MYISNNNMDIFQQLSLERLKDRTVNPSTYSALRQQKREPRVGRLRNDDVLVPTSFHFQFTSALIR